MKGESLNELALFAGAGGGILGSKLLGWDTKCAVEINPFCRRVLLSRQRDGILKPFPIWDDIKTFNGKPWKGQIDVISGGFPCQDISPAGKQRGITGANSGLFFDMLRVIKEVEPTFVFAENSSNLRRHGLGQVVKGLASLGYVGSYGVLGAWHVGAPHRRNRMWIVACRHEKDTRVLRKTVPPNTEVPRCFNPGGGRDSVKLEKPLSGGFFPLAIEKPGKKSPWGAEPRVDYMVNGVASRMERLKALGNGQVPIVAATAWRILSPIAKHLATQHIERLKNAKGKAEQ